MPALSFVLLKTAQQVDPAAVVATFTTLFPDEPPLAHRPNARPDVLDFESGETSSVVTLLPGPVPNGEADEAASRSLSSFREGGFTVPPHHAHLLVVTLGEDTKSAAGLARHTRLVAAVTRAAEAVAVYEGSAGATHEPDFYVDMVGEATYPSMVWNGLSLLRTGEQVELLSLGMKQLDLPDLLLVAPASEGNAALEFFFDLLAYIAGRGERIAEGHTVGRDADEKLVVHYVPSPIDEDVEVARVSMVD